MHVLLSELLDIQKLHNIFSKKKNKDIVIHIRVMKPNIACYKSRSTVVRTEHCSALQGADPEAARSFPECSITNIYLSKD